MAVLSAVDRGFSVYVGQLSTRVPLYEMEELIYELFLQVSMRVARKLYSHLPLI